LEHIQICLSKPEYDSITAPDYSCSISSKVIEERELARATSPKGHARSHYDFVYWDLKYDLEVNSEKESAVEIAKQIKEKFNLE